MWPDGFGSGVPGRARQMAAGQGLPDGGLAGSAGAPGTREPSWLEPGEQVAPGQPSRGQPLPGQSPGGRAPGGLAASGRPPGRRGSGGRRTGGRTLAFTCLLTAGLVGLAASAVGIAHHLLPRQFTPAQQRAISNWEMERRWRSLTEGKIFPASVRYTVPASALFGQQLVLQARLLGVSHNESCAAALSGSAVRLFARYHCSAALRATYVDASGSMVATVAVAVLPNSADASAVVSDLTSNRGGSLESVGDSPSETVARALRIDRTPASSFRNPQRQLSQAVGAGPYVILSSAGFADGRPEVPVAKDAYLAQEMVSLTSGLLQSADAVLGAKPAAPVCPGAPGC
jgi:hypothetical protein